MTDIDFDRIAHGQLEPPDPDAIDLADPLQAVVPTLAVDMHGASQFYADAGHHFVRGVTTVSVSRFDDGSHELTLTVKNTPFRRTLRPGATIRDAFDAWNALYWEYMLSPLMAAYVTPQELG